MNTITNEQKVQCKSDTCRNMRVLEVVNADTGEIVDNFIIRTAWYDEHCIKWVTDKNGEVRNRTISLT